jgi:hypothetical protein
MAREERQRIPRPQSEHPIGAELYSLNRNDWTFLFQAKTAGMTAESLQPVKDALCSRLDGLKAQIQAF